MFSQHTGSHPGLGVLQPPTSTPIGVPHCFATSAWTPAGAALCCRILRSSRPSATQQPERSFETEISSRCCPALPPRTHTAGSSLPFRPQGKCHLLKEEASLSPNPEQLPVTPCQRRGSSSRGRLTALPALRSAAPTEGLGARPLRAQRLRRRRLAKPRSGSQRTRGDLPGPALS